MPSGVKDIQLLELKDTISQLNKTISTQNELISSLQKMLEERNAKDSEKDLLIANLQSQLAYLKNKVFGSTSEIRHDQLDGQLNLFGTPVGDEKPAEVIEPEVISVKGYTKERKPKATYDDKYNSVRSICKHFFTDIVGLSIKFFCVSLRHMSIVRGHVLRPGPVQGRGYHHPDCSVPPARLDADPLHLALPCAVPLGLHPRGVGGFQGHARIGGLLQPAAVRRRVRDGRPQKIRALRPAVKLLGAVARKCAAQHAFQLVHRLPGRPVLLQCVVHPLREALCRDGRQNAALPTASSQ